MESFLLVTISMAPGALLLALSTYLTDKYIVRPALKDPEYKIPRKYAFIQPLFFLGFLIFISGGLFGPYILRSYSPLFQ